MKPNLVSRILLLLLSAALLSVGFAFGVSADDGEDWNLIRYEFDALPSGVINEGTVADGVLTLGLNENGSPASFYTAQAGKVEPAIYAEVAVKAVSGWVNLFITNKISAQGFRVQVRADGEVHLFGGANNGHIDLIGKYDASTYCKLRIELDLEEDVLRVSVNDGEAKEYNATVSAYYASSNTDPRGFRRLLIVGNNVESVAEVDYIRIGVPAAPVTEPPATTPSTTVPPQTTPAATNEPTGTTEPSVLTTEGTDTEKTAPTDNTVLILGIVAIVAAAVVVLVAVVSKRKSPQKK